MTSSGFLRETRRPFNQIAFGSGFTASLLVEEIRRAVNSTNSPRVNGQIKLVPNSLSFLYYRVQVPPAHVSYDYFGAPFDYHVEHVGNIGFYDQILDEVEAVAASRFYSKVSNVKINLGQTLAERRQTVALVATAAAKLASMFLQIRRGKVPKEISSLLNWKNSNQFKLWCGQKWLELQYGWKPLLQDVYGAMIATVDRPPVIPVVVRHKIQDIRENEEAVGEWVFKRTHTLTATCTVKCRLVVDSPGAVKAHELGLDNPLLLAWELCPYSFVVDWFIPIGNWLEAQTAMLGLAALEPQTTTTAECLTHLTVRVNRDTVPLPYRLGYTPTEGVGYKKSKRRFLGVPPVPLPSFKNPLSVSHALSAISLLGQAFWRRTPWDSQGKRQN